MKRISLEIELTYDETEYDSSEEGMVEFFQGVLYQTGLPGAKPLVLYSDRLDARIGAVEVTRISPVIKDVRNIEGKYGTYTEQEWAGWGDQYENCISHKVPVFISHNDECGEKKYSIVAIDPGGFWLDSFDTEKEARDFVKKWRLPCDGSVAEFCHDDFCEGEGIK